MSRPTMQFVSVETEEQQAALMLAGVRQQLITRRTQLSNAIRGYAAEFGLIAAKGLVKVEPLLAQIAQDESLPMLAREMFTFAGPRLRAIAGRTEGSRGAADGLAPRQCRQLGVWQRFRGSGRSAPRRWS